MAMPTDNAIAPPTVNIYNNSNSLDAIASRLLEFVAN